jgi:hypothetical protein
VLYYQKLIRSPDSSQAKVLKVYQKLLKFGKASDQGRTPRLVSEQIKEFNVKIKDRQGTPPGEQGDAALHIVTCEELLYHVKYTY